MFRHPAIPLGAAWLAALLLAPAGALAQGVTATLWAIPAGGTVGDTVNVDLRVLGGSSPFNAYEAVLTCDPSALQFVPRARGEQEGPSMRDVCGSTFYQFSFAADSLSIMNSLLCNQRSLTGQDTLLRLRFVLLGPEQETWIRFRRLLFYEDGLYVNPVAGVDAPIWIVTSLGVAPGPASAGPRLVVSPNPASGPVRLAIERGGAGAGDLWICDLAGRVVRRLLTADVATATVAWDGRGDDGRPAPPGVYTAVYRTREMRVQTHFVRIR